jgi:aconitase A
MAARSDRSDAKTDHIAIAARITASEYAGWRTRQQQEANPRRTSMGHRGNAEVAAVRISKPRAALRLEAGPLAEDLLVLLRRQWKD